MSDPAEYEHARPPERWWQTGYMRAMFDFEELARPDREGAFFRNLDTVQAYTTQLKSLEKQYRLYALLSFLGASLILAGGLPKGAKVALFGFEWPAALISMQLTAVFTASSFGLAMAAMGSLIFLKAMLEHLLAVVPQGVEFVMARYDASHLWTNVLRRRTVGYQSPWPITATNFLFALTGLGLMALHVAIVGVALWTALLKVWAVNASLSFPVLISAVAFMSFAGTVLVLTVGILVPVPFRASAEMKKYWDEQDANVLAQEQEAGT